MRLKPLDYYPEPAKTALREGRRFRQALWATTLLLLSMSCGRIAPEELKAVYQAAAEQLESVILHEMKAKGIPSFSIALADDQDLIWAKSFGWADPQRKIPSDSDTVYRIASVSKLFTAIAIMKLVEEGELDLDRPVSDYVPEFKPVNPFDKAPTLRHLLSHRSGLVREPPVGNYFDPTEPSLSEMVSSLSATELVYEPETRTKYSNAAVGLEGYVLEKIAGRNFTDYMQEAVLDPLEMNSSSFALTEAIQSHLPKALMWRYDGKQFEAPRFQFGFAPAANIYATMPDLAKFMQMLMRRGDGFVQAGSLDQMWTPQFTEEDTGYGLGFYVDRFEGHRRIRHSGAVYGFATDFNVLPEEKIGVCASASLDVSNAVVRRIAEYGLRLLLAAGRGDPQPSLPLSRPVERELARRLDGRYQNDRRKVELYERNGRLFMESEDVLVELQALGNELIVDDCHRYGPRVTPGEGWIRIGEDELTRIDRPQPQPPPVHWSTLVGEYGWDHNTLYIYERDGVLHALIEWTEIDPLTEIEQDVFAFPDFGMYNGENLVFHRDSNGVVTKVVAASIEFERRPVGTPEGETFTIDPVRPVSRLRREALAASPPDASGSELKPDLVEIIRLDPTIKLDIRYASTNNFMQAVFYREPRAFLQRPAAEALVRAHRKLGDQGYGILVHDAYRPWHVTKMFWDATPEEFKIFVANPETGSIHNRGAAVDITLVNLKTGLPVRMPSGYDEFSDRAFADYPGGTSLERWLRMLLRKTMEDEGFSVYPWEWWHFNYEGADRYPIMNSTFDKIQ